MNKQLYLGTANWGKSVSKTEALSILDAYFGNGNNLIDSATNYPINNQTQDYGLALTWLAEWLNSNSNSKLQIFVKIGSVNNKGTSENDLTILTITNQITELQSKFGENLYGVGIHWDNRDSNCKNEILEVVLCLSQLSKGVLQLGISGIKYPEVYSSTSKIGVDWLIQVKEYPGFSLTREQYSTFFPTNRFIAYGISHYLNSQKLNSENEMSELLKRNQYLDCLSYVSKNPALHGCIVGPRNVYHLLDIVKYWRNY
jgi:aryl-alcohol dehydrogenase-like predicted oxidoreductase